MATTHTHTGPHTTIPPTASPGLLFLAAFLPAVDGATSSLSPFLAPTATFIINGGDPTPAEAVLALMAMRAQRLKTFRHELRAAWDVDHDHDHGHGGGRPGRRTLLYESVSVTVFADDPDEKAIEVCEFSTLELEDAGPGKGVQGLVASVLKTFMDANPILQRMKQIGGRGPVPEGRSGS